MFDGLLIHKPSLPRKFASLATLLFALSGCMGQTRAARLQDDAREYAMALRFGRTSMARAYVAPKALGQFARHYARWGRDVRVVDMELVGIEQRDPNEARVYVNIGWQRLDGSDLHVTRVEQHWQFIDHEWRIVGEKAIGGDVSLFGEEKRGNPLHP